MTSDDRGAGSAIGLRLALVGSHQKKLRGMPRRLRAISAWADRFEGWFPPHDAFYVDGRGSLCWYAKMPAYYELEHSTRARSACAQSLLRAASSVAASTPSDEFTVGAMIYAPTIRSSEVFAYATPLPLLGLQISDLSLAAEWSLEVPPGLQEHGRIVVFDEDDPDERWETEMWWYISDRQANS